MASILHLLKSTGNQQSFKENDNPSNGSDRKKVEGHKSTFAMQIPQ